MANFEYSDSMVQKTVTLTTQNAEYSLVLPDGVKQIDIQARESVDIRIAFNAPGLVAGSTDPYSTIKSGTKFSKQLLYLQGNQTIYFSCGAAATHVEVTYWL